MHFLMIGLQEEESQCAKIFQKRWNKKNQLEI